MSKATKITWQLVEVKAGDLKPNPDNPKTRDAKGFKRLQKSLAKFGKVFDGIANKDLTLIDGHSRLDLNNDDKVKVFIPSRQLSPDEYKEMNAIFDIAKAGDTDQQMLEESFSDEFFEEWQLDKKGAIEKQTIELKPYKRTHILLSFPPEKMIELQPLLQKIADFKYVEYEQSSN